MYSIKKKAAIALIMLYTAGYYLWIAFFNGNELSRIIISNTLQTIPPLFVFILLLRTYINVKFQKERFWLLLTIGCGSYLLSQLIWNYYEIILGIYNPAFALAAFLWPAATISFIIALFMKVRQKNNVKSAKIFIIDTLTIMCVAVAVTWLYSIQPAFDNMANQSILPDIVYLAYPVFNLVCLFASVNLYFSLGQQDMERKPLYIICLSFLVMFVANSIYSHLSVLEIYASGSFMDPLWSLHIMLLGLAAIVQNELPSDAAKTPYQDQIENFPPKLFIAFPFLSVILLFGLMVFFNSKVVWFCSALSIALVTMRYILTILQNKQLILKLGQLNSTLEGKVTERTHELYNMAFYDQLTGLPNRRMFEDSLRKSVFFAYQNNTPLGLMFLDLDRFKTVNDNFGHSYGDLMLREVADRIKGCTDENAIISRQGGDEFALIIENNNSTQYLSDLAQRILLEIAKPIRLFDQSIHTSCSIGIALYSRNCEDPETLMRYADAAMYYSKEKGKNTYQFYTEGLDQFISKKLELETELSKAMENQEFFLYYQPQVNIISGDITGAEALLRWKHPVLGLISPQDFIPIAEESGIIKEIGQWVLKTACIQAKKWHDEGYDKLKIGVNLSSKQIQMDNFVQLVSEIIEETKLQPEYLDLEITESASFQNEAEVIKKLNELKKLGIQISIDDFGTGYSSLSYLNKLPVDTLKIAQEFVKNIKVDETNKAIISSIIAVAKSLNLKVIAEGVEERYQYNFLKSQNCFDMQGYLFGRPLPIEEFMALIKENDIQRIKLDA